MDIIHHALIGGAGFSVAVEANQPVIGAAFVLGSILPDLDVFFMLLGKRFYLRNHQAITHSLLLAPLFAVLICLTLNALLSIEWEWYVFYAAIAGITIHITLDWFNTFRIALFAPFTSRRYSLDAVFFIDVVALLLTGFFYLLIYYKASASLLFLYPLLFSLYFILKLYLHHITIKNSNSLYAIPSSINPVEFYILKQSKSGYTGSIYNVITKKEKQTLQYPLAELKYQKMANTSPVFCDMLKITRHLQITDIKDSQLKIIITASDIAVRNFGGKFATTIMTFDTDGKLLHEVANI